MERGRLEASDAEEFAEMHSPAWDLDFEQISPGSFHATKEYRRSKDALVYCERYSRTVRATGQPTPGTIVLAAVNKIGQSGRWWGRRFPESGLPMTTQRRGVDLVLPEGCEDTVVIFPIEELREYIGILTGAEPGWLHGPGAFLALPESSCDYLKRSWRGAIHRLPGAGGASLFDELASSLASVLPHNATCCKEPASRSALVRRAIELVDANEDPIPISKLCLLLRVSQRALHFAFTDQTGESPNRYFRLRRMNRSRRMLRRARPGDTTVSEIAMECGFHELGRFAVEYKRLFGESPSETLRAAEQGATVSLNVHPWDKKFIEELTGALASVPPQRVECLDQPSLRAALANHPTVCAK